MSTVPVPPPNAAVHTTCCEYCPVACGYRVYTWPVGHEGGQAASDNALGVDYPQAALTGGWPTENMHNVTVIDGRQHNVLIVPDATTQAVNIGGTHSVRGGAIAQKIWSPTGRTADRLQRPLLRVNGQLVPISWDMALDLVADLSTYVLQEWDELAWGMKLYSYQYYENVYAATKLALGEIGTPNFSPHHAPADGDDVPGLSDTGIDAFGSAFADDAEADVIMICGSDPYETKTVRFTTYQAAGGAALIYVDPRRTFTAAYAEQHGGLHLQLHPGTDTALYSALAREIVERGWYDRDFVDHHTASRADMDAEGKWRRRRFGMDFAQLRDHLLSRDEFTADGAAAITGVPADQIREAARLLTGGGGERPKTSILFEKGVYWSHNYENTAAVGNLGVLLGAVGRPGRTTSRMGGHQRGGQRAAGYPLDKSPHFFEDHPVEMDTERWLVEGNTRFRWVVGTNWISAMGASQALRSAVADLVNRGPRVTTSDPDGVRNALQARMDAGGMVIVQQEIYLNESTELADLVLPAATWGEEDFARNNAERRLRIYEKFMDAPGEARPDWWIFAQVAQRMGYDGFGWQDTNEIFEEASERSRGGRRDFAALVELARQRGMRAHDLLRQFGTTGVQTPLSIEAGELVETERLHADLRFKTDSGKANFVLADWDAVADRNQVLGPDTSRGELWVLNGRVNAIWNSMFDHSRREITTTRWPMNFLEIHPDDATPRGLENGDIVSVESDNVLDQLGRRTSASFTAAAYITEVVPPGVTYTYFLYPGSPSNSITSGDSSLQPLNLRYNFKLGRGRVRRIGASGLAQSMSFAPRNLAPEPHVHEHLEEE